MSPKIPPSKKGIRQAQEGIVGKMHKAPKAVPRTAPHKLDEGKRLQANPLCPFLEYSAIKIEAPLYSPEVQSPCKSRHTTIMMGAASPISLYVGRNPIVKVGMVTSRMESISAFRRP